MGEEEGSAEGGAARRRRRWWIAVDLVLLAGVIVAILVRVRDLADDPSRRLERVTGWLAEHRAELAELQRRHGGLVSLVEGERRVSLVLLEVEGEQAEAFRAAIEDLDPPCAVRVGWGTGPADE